MTVYVVDIIERFIFDIYYLGRTMEHMFFHIILKMNTMFS